MIIEQLLLRMHLGAHARTTHIVHWGDDVAIVSFVANQERLVRVSLLGEDDLLVPVGGGYLRR